MTLTLEVVGYMLCVTHLHAIGNNKVIMKEAYQTRNPGLQHD